MSTNTTIITPTQQTLTSGAILFHWPCPSPSPRALLFLQHGFGDYSERMLRDNPYILSDLHALNIDLWAMDMYAFGKSPGTPRAVADVEKLVADHISARQKVLEHPRSQISNNSNDTQTTVTPTYRPLFLLGQSLGGLVAASSASQDPTHLKGVILSAPALTLTHPILALVRNIVSIFARVIPSTRIPMSTATSDQLTRNQSMLTKWHADELVYHGQVSFLIAASALKSGDALFKKIHEWRVPVLVTHGDKDALTDHGQSKRFVEAVQDGVDKEFYSVKDGRHDLFSDDGFEVVWRHVLGWIEARLE